MRDLLSVSDLTVRFGRRLALDRVSFDVPAGETVAVVGPNGAGKTTLFRAILGSVEPTLGSVASAERPAYVPQSDDEELHYPLTALDVVLIGAYRRKPWYRPLGRALRNEALDQLARVGLADRAGSQIGELSGGQRQRVLLARALLSQRRLLLLDEPLNGVDATTQEVIVSILAELRAEGRSMLISTHDLTMARRISTSMLFLNQTVVAYGPADEAFTPEILRRTFAGSLLVVEGEPGLVEVVDSGSCGHAHVHGE
ncbi:MAG TPA: metal ABC transporter ATP-binding protein [Gaiellales bacterium]|jgi:ABC-type Mn2+/Zn2+ transport system ATPase subunit